MYFRRTLGEAWKQVKATTLLESRIHEDFGKKVSLINDVTAETFGVECLY